MHGVPGAIGGTGVALLIYFIHHIAVSIQASTILSNIAAEAIGAIEALAGFTGVA